MILVAYLSLLAAGVWLLRRGRRAPASPAWPARLLGTLVAAALAGIGLMLLPGATATALATALLAALVCGAAVYVAGVAVWEGRAGRRLRTIGWIGMVVPLLVPSTLTLALPLLALLALTLPERNGGGAPARARTPARL